MGDSNSLYKESYGAWAGNREGRKPNLTLCCEAVWIREGNWSRESQCTRKRGFGPDLAYCKQHDPAAVEARKKAATAKYNEQHNRERYSWHGRSFFDALQKIADGHNDARGFAHGKPDGAVREALRAICKAGNELGCSCADRNYQWFDQSCKELMADAFRKMLADEAALHSSKIAAAETSPGDAYREVIDEALIVRHLGVAKGNAKAELNQILDWDVAAALDPAVSGRKA
jgi:hypothetical protein